MTSESVLMRRLADGVDGTDLEDGVDDLHLKKGKDTHVEIPMDGLDLVGECLIYLPTMSSGGIVILLFSHENNFDCIAISFEKSLHESSKFR